MVQQIEQLWPSVLKQSIAGTVGTQSRGRYYEASGKQANYADKRHRILISVRYGVIVGHGVLASN